MNGPAATKMSKARDRARDSSTPAGARRRTANAPDHVLAFQRAAGNEAVKELLLSDARTSHVGVPSPIQAVLRNDPGELLESSIRGSMEDSFGEDFSDVKIHVGDDAAQSALDLRAKAYTAGSDIVFGPGAYSPHESAGKRLLAHELAHVVQQRSDQSGGSAPTAAEAEARSASEQAGSGQTASVQASAPVSVQRDEATEADLRKLEEAQRKGGHSPQARQNNSAMNLRNFDEPQDLRGWFGPSAAGAPTAAPPGPKAQKPPDQTNTQGQTAPPPPGARAAELKTHLADNFYKTHPSTWKTEAQAVRFVDDYLAYAKDRPDLKAFYDAAVARRTEVLTWIRNEFERRDVEAADRMLGQLKASNFVGAVQVPVPYPIQQREALAPVVLPIADVAVELMKFVPYVGPAISLLEAATGRTHMGLGFEMSDEERVIGAVLGALPFAGRIVRSGAQRAAVIAQISRNTGVPPANVFGHLRKLAVLEGEAATLRSASAALKAGRELTAREAQALGRLERSLGRQVRPSASGLTPAAGQSAEGPAQATVQPPTNIASRRTPAENAAVQQRLHNKRVQESATNTGPTREPGTQAVPREATTGQPIDVGAHSVQPSPAGSFASPTATRASASGAGKSPGGKVAPAQSHKQAAPGGTEKNSGEGASPKPPSGEPTPQLRGWAQHPGFAIDPATNKVLVTPNKLAADHILPKQVIKGLPDFEKLPAQQQKMLLEYPMNFQPLLKRWNSSKGKLLASKWAETPVGSTAHPEYIKWLAQTQADLREAYTQQIQIFLKGNPGG